MKEINAIDEVKTWKRFALLVTVRNSSCGKVMFSQASVILFGGGVSQHALGQTPPWADRPPPSGHCSQADTPPNDGRYASYWNAFLLLKSGQNTIVILVAIVTTKKKRKLTCLKDTRFFLWHLTFSFQTSTLDHCTFEMWITPKL